MKKTTIFLSIGLALILISAVCVFVFNDTSTYTPKDGIEIVASLSTETAKHGDRLTATFAFDEEPKNWRYDADSIKIVDVRKESGEVALDIIALDGAGECDFYADFGYGDQKATVYTYSENDMVFASTDAEDTVWYRNLEYSRDNGFITEAEAQQKVGEYSRKDVVITKLSSVTEASSAAMSAKPMSSSSSDAAYFEGRVQWQYLDSAGNTVTAPLKNARVVLFDEDFWTWHTEIAETYTDENGDFRIEWENGTGLLESRDDTFVRIYASGDTFDLWTYTNIDWAALLDMKEIYKMDWDMGWYFESPTFVNVESGSTTRYNYTVGYNEKNNRNRAFYAAQGLVAAQTFAFDEEPKNWRYDLAV
jgi:hypothetical protein